MNSGRDSRLGVGPALVMVCTGLLATGCSGDVRYPAVDAASDRGQDAAARDSAPDQVQLDSQIPVILVDDTFADFRHGTLTDPGVKIYVSNKGNVQLVDRLDLNSDGWLDLVFSQNGGSPIYWGSASGFTASNKQPLSAGHTGACSTADFDDDGFPDIVFSVLFDPVTKKSVANSMVYWGSSTGYSHNKTTLLPTLQANASSVADFNLDGYLDMVISNSTSGNGVYKVNSYVYWGSASGFSATNRAELPTNGTETNTVADLDGDGYPDIVFGQGEIYIYWGSSKGLLSRPKQTIATGGVTMGVAAADLNKDGHLDLVAGRDEYPSNPQANSYIYWGSAKGLSAANKKELPTVGANGVAVADLNNDGDLDIVFSNNHDAAKKTFSINSYVYWGPKFTVAARTELPTTGAAGNLVVDLDGNGYPDIVFDNQRNDAGKFNINSITYWGSSKGFNSKAPTLLPTVGPGHSTTTDPGSVHNRKPEQTFTSRTLDAAAATTCTQLKVTARVPLKTKLRFQVRSATSTAGLAKAAWYGPTSTTDHYEQPNAGISNPTVNSTKIFTLNKAHAGQRYLQYRATLSHDFGNTPVLDRVEISCK